jgi:hypothetical protein
MRKTLLGITLFVGLSFVGATVSAKGFEAAVAEYKQETGTATYRGEELQPMWFKDAVNDVDTNGDGIKDTRFITPQFWLFGHCFWQGQTGEGQHIPGTT